MSPATNSNTIAVAVSGGADSLYAMLRLAEEGERVLALHALFLPDWLRPAGYGEMLVRLAERCAELGAEFRAVDLSEAFARRVILPFFQSYAAGDTPNPCASCNAGLKFGLLLEEAERLGARYLASGHYARRVEDVEAPHGFALFAGQDSGKDQSYFLSLTPAAALARVHFPLGEISKSEVLSFLRRRGIVAPQAGESQEICFVSADYRDFLRAFAGRTGLSLPGPGPVRLPDGRVLGEHKGLWQYTEGQRHGLGLAAPEPLFVLRKEPAGNALIVGPRSAFGVPEAFCRALNFFLPPEEWPAEVLVKTRYRQQLQPAQLELAGSGEGRLVLREAGPPPAAGQVAAFYRQEKRGLRLLAGGSLVRAH